MIYRAIQHPETQKNIAEVTISADSIPSIKSDSITNDTIKVIPNVINREELIAQENYPPTIRKTRLVIVFGIRR